jgi:hypothetical protein
MKTLLVIFIAGAVTAVSAGTAIHLPFASSFPGADYVQTPGYSWEDIPGNAPWQGMGDNTTLDGGRDVINATHNNPGGAGGKGFGHCTGDGHNNDGGCIRLEFENPVGEFWARFYLRYPAGYAWAGGQPYYQKIIYLNPNAGDESALVFQWREGKMGSGW